jgi:hypothetical protein
MSDVEEKQEQDSFINHIAGPGQPKKFNTPQQAWDEFLKYVKWCEENPIQRADVCKAGDNAGMQIHANVPRPFTMEGVYNFLNINAETFRNYEGRGTNEPEGYKEYIETFTRIRATVRQQKLEGALSGNYHANLVAKELGLTENVDITSNGKEIKTIIEFGGKEVQI